MIIDMNMKTLSFGETISIEIKVVDRVCFSIKKLKEDHMLWNGFCSRDPEC